MQKLNGWSFSVILFPYCSEHSGQQGYLKFTVHAFCGIHKESPQHITIWPRLYGCFCYWWIPQQCQGSSVTDMVSSTKNCLANSLLVTLGHYMFPVVWQTKGIISGFPNWGMLSNQIVFIRHVQLWFCMLTPYVGWAFSRYRTFSSRSR